MKKPPRVAQLKITEFSSNGFGVGIDDSQQARPLSIEVPFSTPGDEIVVGVHRGKKGIHQGKPLHWLKLSPKREKPICRHFGRCGGCRWQHITYEQQLQQKESWLHELLDSYIDVNSHWYPIIPCSPSWYYRNKMEFSFSQDRAGSRYLGLMLQGSRGKVFQLKACHFMYPWVIEIVDEVSKWWEETGLQAYHSFRRTGSLRTLTVREGLNTGDRMVILTVSADPTYVLSKKHLDDFVINVRKKAEPLLAHQNLSIFLRIQQVIPGKPTQFYEMHLYGPAHICELLHIEIPNQRQRLLQVQISPTAFFQPNTKQAEKIYTRLLQLTSVSSDSLVYDLYCGTGTIGICFANYVKRVIGVELVPEAVIDGKENIKLNGLLNMSIIQGDVGKVLHSLIEENGRPHLVIIDPPRMGLDRKALQHLLTIRAPQIAYISCNPSSQADNLLPLIEAGYRVQAVQPVDQFPHTVHIENIIILTL
jgi:23S rRNA (uracil1939-C5)-methyltransferase